MGLFDAIASVVTGTINAGLAGSQNQYNKDMQEANKNWAFADSRAANSMLQYFMANGNLEGFNPSVINQDYNDVANYLNPYLSLSSQHMAKRAQDFAEETWKKSFDFQKDQADYQKYIAENAVSIRANDFKNSGFSPLLAVPGGASASTVSANMGTMSSPSSSYTSNRPGFTPINPVQIADLGKAMAEIKNINAQTENIKADTSLKGAQYGTELMRPDLIIAQTGKEKEASKNIKENTQLIIEKIKSEPYNRQLTQNQIEKFASEIAVLDHNLEQSKLFGIRTTDQLPVMLEQVENIVSSLGIDTNTNLYRALVATGFIGLNMFGATLPFKNKFKLGK